MTAVLIIAVIVLAVALLAVSGMHLGYRRRRPARVPAPGARRILFPFVANALSVRALDAALRIANAEDATLVPVFLARVPLHLPLNTPLPRQSNIAILLHEAIEQRATEFGIPVDARVERGRTYRHALRETVVNERFDRMVVAAAVHGGHGFGPDDVAWLLENAPGEIAVLRPSEDEPLGPPPPRQPRRPRTRTRKRVSAQRAV
jgi:hypothetical protein